MKSGILAGYSSTIGDPDSRKRYKQKLTLINNIDPYEIPVNDWLEENVAKAKQFFECAIMPELRAEGLVWLCETIPQPRINSPFLACSPIWRLWLLSTINNLPCKGLYRQGPGA